MVFTTSQNGDRSAMLENLRHQIRAIEGFKPSKAENFIRLGIPEIDEAFPDNGIPLSATHEFIAENIEAVAASVSFIAALVSKIDRPGSIVWVERGSSLYPPGLAEYGIDASDIIFMQPRNEKDALAVIEEALRTTGLKAVIGEIDKADLNATRRLQMATQDSGTVGFLMRMNKNPQSILSASATRWKIKYGLSEDSQGLPGLGETRWNVLLDKVRHGRAASWELDWLNNNFSLISPKAKPEIIQPNRYADNVRALFG